MTQIAAALWLIALVWAGVAGITPPAVVPETAPPGEFSAARAMRHLRVIAAHPHPVGSLENQKVREYLVAQLESLGLHPEVQEATALNERKSSAARVYNILARKAGMHAGLALALAAHYDSVPAGPGAGDDGAGVAALLETARALNADSAPLRNDVLFLFTDGEEAGLFGAKAFVAENPAAKEIGLILNFEGRGDSGPSMMFETSSENGWLIGQLAGAAPFPRASSTSAAVYSQMPNSTDLSVFKQAGLAGLNFAFIGSPERYHTPEDTPENLDQRSLQHHGSYALALARRFGNLDLANHNEPDDIFFNLSAGHSWFVSYPIEWAKPIAIAVALMFLVVTSFGFGGGHLKLGGLSLGVAAFAISSALAWRGTSALVRGLFALHRHALPDGPVAQSAHYGLAAVSLAVTMTATLWELARRRKNWGATWQNLAYVGLTAWTLLAVLSAFYFPAGSYLCAWPALAGVLAAGLVFAGAPLESPWTCAALAVGAAPGVLLIVPLALLLFAAFGVDSAALAAIALVIVLLLWSLVPLVVGMGLRRWLLVISATASVFFLARGAAAVRYTAENPRRENIFYLLDADAGKADWLNLNVHQTAVPGAPPDAWAAQYVSASPARIVSGEYFALRGKVPLFEHAAPVLEDAAHDGTRTLRVSFRSPRHAREIQMMVEAQDSAVTLVAIDGQPVEGSEKIVGSARVPRLFFHYSGVTYAGIEVTLEITATSSGHAAAPVQINLVDYSAGLPEIPGQSFRPRPASISTQHSADMTMVSKSYSF